ncbi:PEP/pyruvate-binding domain-containing protein [Micromonospora sp. NPDC002296]|uniref:PEP/pyruvate-binding domain-containing protein n=1 Tax=Micromonospora sp. NPDC002296 TaxID=3154271 RepID=UPI00332577F6
MPDVIALSAVGRDDTPTVGAKAANLGELIGVGVPVPPGFCLPTSVYERFAQPAVAPHLALLARGDEQAAGTLRAAIEAIELPATLLTDLEEAFRTVCPAGGAVAVRSSGTSEDTADTSFAGQYHTELGVRTFDRLVNALLRCWASLWDVHAIHYRDRVGLPHAEARMAVVVQALVPADAAGVMFVTAPTAAVTEPVVIESSWGLGEAVVSGVVTPDRHVVDRDGHRLLSTEHSHKPLMVTPAEDGATVVDVPPQLRDTPSLTGDQAVALARLGIEVQEHFGTSQDIEWAITDGRIAILQARPLTRDVVLPEGVRWRSPIEGAEWARISICDSWLPEPLSPLFATTLFPRLVRKWKQNWSGSDPRIDRLLPEPMSGTINGYAYIRLDTRLKRHPVQTGKLVAAFFRFHLARLDRQWRTTLLPHHVERIEALRRITPATLTTRDVLAVIDEAEELSAVYWALLGGLAWYWNGGEWLLDRLYRSLAPPEAAEDGFAVLLQGYPTKTSEMDVALFELATADGPGGGPPDGFDQFLEGYAHQAYQLDFVEPTPVEDPSAILTTLEAYREGRLRSPHDRLRDLAGQREESRTTLLRGLRRKPVRRAALRALLRWTRYYAHVRDEALHYFTMGWPTIRRGYLELGRRLADAGALSAADDVFFLSADELSEQLRVLGAGDRPADLAETVRLRRELREQQRQVSPPAQVPRGLRVEVAGVDFLPIAFLGRSEDPDESSADLSGFAVSPGLVTATARHVSSVRDFTEVRPGDVLVATYVTPAWSPLLGIAGGIITDSGGALSHGSIVAREYGIPAVMGTGNATKVIQNGQIVTVDGTRGLVYLTEGSPS